LGAATASLLLGLVALQTVHQTELRTQLMELADNHMRSVLSGRLVDVASPDPHVVRPWFAGKVSFSPPIPDLTAAGYALAGGRMDYVAGHSAAALVYRLAKHDISVFIWADPRSESSPPTLQPPQLGYNIVGWQAAGLTVRAISDLPAKDLRDFASAFFNAANSPNAP
jgi:anti-sigma factor RsiW